MKLKFIASLASVFFLFTCFLVFPKTTLAQCSPPPTCSVPSDCNRAACAGCSWCGSSGGSAINWEYLYQVIQPGGGAFPMHTTTTTGAILNALVGYLFPIAGLLMILYLLYGGFQYLTSGGNPQKAQAASGIITTALIGFILVFTAYWITQLVGNILGLTDISGIFR